MQRAADGEHEYRHSQPHAFGAGGKAREQHQRFHALRLPDELFLDPEGVVPGGLGPDRDVEDHRQIDGSVEEDPGDSKAR